MDQENKISCSKILKNISGTVRLSIIEELLKGPRFVQDINKSIKIEQSLLSHHLKNLREVGLVISERVGKGVLYKLSDKFVSNENRESLDLGCCSISFKSIRGLG